VLKRRPSLAFRAAFIFFVVCTAIFVAALTVVAFAAEGSPAEALRSYLDEGVLVVLFWIAVITAIVTAMAVPLLTRAVRPILQEAALIGVDCPENRLDEGKAPRELLPLVRAFNSALDRLSDELARRKSFIANVAHELRTPLAILTLRADSIEDDAAREDVQRGIRRLSDMVDQMLQVERLSLNRRTWTQFDLTAVATDVVADMAPMAFAGGYEISLDAPSEPVLVQGDCAAVERAIVNLVGNSVAHAGGKGRIRVEVRSELSVDVADEGPGVPASLRSQLFEPFCRDHWDTDGCGLGLYLTREIMRFHGGDARLVPSGHGARFRLEFPTMFERDSQSSGSDLPQPGSPT
jgi:signal transduction histidine kinase